MAHLTDPKTDFPQWYLDVIEQAQLSDYSDVKGCIIFRPYGYAIWEAIQTDLNRRIKALGVQNAYFPLFIPESLMLKEAKHVEGFAPECAVVTHGGGKELAEKLYVRPTSETIIYATFAKWVQSYRDLPLKINQWANVVRWEMRTRPFLRTLEFLWQEGHTCHATKEDADAMVEAALGMYRDFDRDVLAIPVVTGRKPEHEKFAGALYTLSTEALARDGKAIQAGTSHNLGQGFSEAYDVSFLDSDKTSKRPWMTSWGVSTRLIGTLIVVHGDEKGLRLPPAIAPIQVVVVPIYKSDEEREQVLAAAKNIMTSLPDVRMHLDDRDGKSPGFKFNEWETKGVPIRFELGPKDLAAGQVTLAKRTGTTKEQKPLADLSPAAVAAMLAEVQQELLTQAETFLRENTHEVSSESELLETLESKGGFVWAPWDGDVKTAERIKDRTKATVRLVRGGPEQLQALFAKAY